MNDDLERLELPEPAAWAATSEEGAIEALGFNQSRRFDTGLFTIRQLLAAILADRQRRAQAAGIRAWETDDGRVISTAQKEQALRDGGASASSVAPYSIPLVVARAQAAEPVAWLKRGGKFYVDTAYMTKANADKSAGNDPGSEVVPLYTRAAPAEVTDDMVRRAVQATVDYIFNKAPAHEDVITARDNAMRAALVAALGGGE